MTASLLMVAWTSRISPVMTARVHMEDNMANGEAHCRIAIGFRKLI